MDVDFAKRQNLNYQVVSSAEFNKHEDTLTMNHLMPAEKKHSYLITGWSGLLVLEWFGALFS